MIVIVFIVPATVYIMITVVKYNGTAHIKNVNNSLNTNIYTHIETPGNQSSNLYLNVVHFFNTSVN
jgi:hypothetical protein